MTLPLMFVDALELSIRDQMMLCQRSSLNTTGEEGVISSNWVRVERSRERSPLEAPKIMHQIKSILKFRRYIFGYLCTSWFNL